MKNQYLYDSCGAGKICAHCWIPDGEIRAIVQIVHGIVEHMGRYDQFARYLNKHGILVVGEDHMGHGISASNGSVKGYFTGGWDAAIRDTYRLTQDTMAKYPDVPFFLLGHSMGSFMARTILWKYPNSGIRGAVISGTAWMDHGALLLGKTAAGLFCRYNNPKTPAKILNDMAFGSYNKRVEHPRTPSDWLSRDAVRVDDYIADPMCGFIPSGGLMKEMMEAVAEIQKEENLKTMNPELPVLFVAGGDDPVGNYGKGVREAAGRFSQAGMKLVEIKIFPLCRHEILNEINRAEVFRIIRRWIVEKMV